MNPIPHGTHAGYERCKALLGEACSSCKRAEADHQKEWRKTNGDAAKRAKIMANIRQKAKTILSQKYKEEYKTLCRQLEKELSEKVTV